MDNIVRLNKSHIVPAAETLARAFQDYPLNSYFFPNASERMYKLPYTFRMVVHYGVLYGEVYATSPNLEGIAIWLSSDKADMTLWGMVRSGAFSMIPRVGVGVIGKINSFNEYTSPIHKRHISSHHWYLQFIGIDPEYQGKGFARVLLKPMLARADTECLPCYLETHKPKNVSIFQHYGFEVVDEGIIPNSEVTQLAMLRKNAE